MKILPFVFGFLVFALSGCIRKGIDSIDYQPMKNYKSNLNQSVDTLDIIYKGKLLSVLRFGLVNQKELELEFKSRKSEILRLKSTDSFILLRLFNDQSYIIPTNDGNQEKMCNYDCEFTLAYSINFAKFYKLQGFPSNDFREFYIDLRSSLNSYESLVELSELKSLNYSCLINKYVKQMKNHRNIDCYEICEESCGIEYRIY